MFATSLNVEVLESAHNYFQNDRPLSKKKKSFISKDK